MRKLNLILAVLVLSISSQAGISSFFKTPVKFVVKKVGIKTGSKVLSESMEEAIKTSCRETTEAALKFAAKYGDDAGKLFVKYGDDAVRITAKHGDDAIKLFSKYGDDMIKISKKYGDNGVGVFIKHSKELKPLMAKYGDNIIQPYIDHPGLGGKLVKEFGEDAIKISGKMDDEAAIIILKKSGSYNKSTLVKKILLNSNGKISKVKMTALIAGGGVAATYAGPKIYESAKRIKTFITRPLTLTEKIILSVFFLFICIYIVIKMKFNQKVKECK